VSENQIGRRSFLARLSAGMAAAFAVRVPVVAATKPRPCYVHLGQNVSYIGEAKYPSPTFIGSSLVRDIEPFDGKGYPCRVASQTWEKDKLMPGVFYDHDLATLHEIPRDVYLREVRSGKYPNIHAWVRHERSGGVRG